MLSNAERFDRLDAYIAEDRIIRRAWTRRVEGRERACLLAALSPEAGVRGSSDACPASVMPQWLAYLTPWIDDNGSNEAWPGVIRRYAAIARQWHVLTPETWKRLDYTARAICVRESLTHVTAGEYGARTAIEHVLALLDRARSGEAVAEREWKDACSRPEARAPVAAAALEVSMAETTQPQARGAVRAAWGAVRAAKSAQTQAVDAITSQILTAIEEAVEAQLARAA